MSPIVFSCQNHRESYQFGFDILTSIFNANIDAYHVSPRSTYLVWSSVDVILSCQEYMDGHLGASGSRGVSVLLWCSSWERCSSSPGF
ncbi:hypothetical protein RDI58_010664 [Solanum bulbocastanum]|uniref:Uncharacterized protein n=1 Tax=Solanum bulbocastanum TaxID=147425 RepID=A0AAN8TNC2_SOLBU